MVARRPNDGRPCQPAITPERAHKNDTRTLICSCRPKITMCKVVTRDCGEGDGGFAP
ncbi:hypothetical protein I3760_09G149100 [Carya illinoinensis]|nr:hypothetical protein I3760_09G149100 [Carya illinoinensis]